MPDGPAEPLRVLFAASEVAGFAKTGGLADVCAALPRALGRLGHRCAVILPLYRSARLGSVPLTQTDHVLAIPLGRRVVPARLWTATLPDSDVTAYLVEQHDYFERDHAAEGRGLYHYTLATGQKRDYPDNGERFLFFCRAVLEALPRLDFQPQVLHANDWQTGLVPVYLREVYRHRASFPYDRLRCLFTIHNIAYQGLLRPGDYLPMTNLDPRLFNHRQLEFYGQLNCLKAGIVFADRVSTVSPTYAREIQTSAYGCGLQGVLSARSGKVTGIVNGIDYREWNPASDPHLPAAYDVDSVSRGKPLCKAALQRQFGLAEDPRAPVLGMVARLAEQKGIDLVLRSAEMLIQEGEQLVVLGEGDPDYHVGLQLLQRKYPTQVGLSLSFDEKLAHQIEAGADLFLMPSQYEPSGLNQLYSLRYGTVPVVRATGGLADTITDTTPETIAAGTATGFQFLAYTPAAFEAAVHRALAIYRTDPALWLRIQQTGMRQDWSWTRSARAYEELYRQMLAEPDGGR